MARTGIAALCLLLVAFVDLGSSTRCYLCTSVIDPQCGDPFSSDKVLDQCGNTQVVSEFNKNHLKVLGYTIQTLLPNPRYHCLKVVLQNGMVTRSCLDVDPNNPNGICDSLARQNPTGPMQLKHCSVCERDDCNGASTQIASISLALVALTSTYFSYRQ